VFGGIDIGNASIVVATPGGTVRHRNAIREVDGPVAGDGEEFVIRTEGGSYAIGNAVEGSVDGDGPAGLLFGGPEEERPDGELAAKAVEALFSRSSADRSTSRLGESDLVGYVDRGGSATAELSRAVAELGVDSQPIDPGMAVCYDVFGSSPTGLGVAIADGTAFATLAAGGIPVATARVAYEDRWFDVTDTVGDLRQEGPRAEWARLQYEALFAELAAEVSATGPSPGEPVPVAVGGGAAPIGLGTDGVRALGDRLGTGVESVTVAESPGEALARGALAGIEGGGEGDGPGGVPAVAATDEYAAGPTDAGEAADAFAATFDPGSTQRSAAVDGRAASEPGGEETDDRRAREHRARLASGLGRLADRLDEEAPEPGDALREEVQAAIADVEADIEHLEARTATAGAVTELEASVAETEETLAELEGDITQLRAAVTGIDASGIDDQDAAEALETVATDALRDDIDAVETDLSSRIEGLWEAIDEVNDQLVDVSAQVEELPDVEQAVESIRESVEGLSERTTGVSRSLQELRESFAELEETTPTAGELQSVSSDVDRIAGDLDALEREFRDVDRVEPATVDELARDLDALRETVVDHAKRLEGVERTASDLEDRIEQAFKDTAKAEALASLQAEVSRIRTTASQAAETANSTAETTDSLASTVGEVEEELDQVHRMVDSLAESSATRSEVDDSIAELESRIAGLEDEHQRLRQQLSAQGAASPAMLQLIAIGLAAIGGVGALLAFELQQQPFAIGFVVAAIVPAAWLWLSVPNR